MRMDYLGSMSRVLGYVRLSRLTSETTSPARQREVIERWVKHEGHDLIDIVSDLDVSGAKSPLERPELGPRLTAADDFDILAAAKLDRLSRSAADVHDLLRWADEKGKTLVAISDGIDTSTANGRIFVQIASIFAEVERSNIQERVASARESMRRLGRWPAGRPPYGFKLVPQDFDGSMGYVLDEDPESADQLREIIDEVLKGKSLVQIAKDLNDRGVLTPRNYTRPPEKRTESEWVPQTLMTMLRNPALLGYSTHRPKLPGGKRGNPEIIHEHGKPVEFGPPLIDRKTWNRLQAELDSREQPSHRRRDTPSMLLGVAFCAECGHRLHLSWGGAGKYRRRTYRCTNYRDGKCPVGPIYKDRLEQWVEGQILALCGDWEIPKVKLEPGEDHREELEAAEESLRLLMRDRENGHYRTAIGERIFAEKLAEYESIIEQYEKAPVKPASIHAKPSGKTLRQLWLECDEEERRQILLMLPYYVTVGPAEYRGSRDWESRCRLMVSEEKYTEQVLEADVKPTDTAENFTGLRELNASIAYAVQQNYRGPIDEDE